MTHFVNIRPVNGRHDFFDLVNRLKAQGIEDAEYSAGGWVDGSLQVAEPHIKFAREDDALAFVLAYGGIYCTEKPMRW